MQVRLSATGVTGVAGLSAATGVSSVTGVADVTAAAGVTDVTSVGGESRPVRGNQVSVLCISDDRLESNPLLGHAAWQSNSGAHDEYRRDA